MNAAALPRRLAAFAPAVFVGLAGLAISFSTQSESLHYIGTLVLIWAVFGSSWNVISGYGGQMAFGHAMFFGIGAYVSTLLMAKFGISPFIGVWVSMASAAAASVLIGWPTFRLSGVYFSLATLAYPLMVIPLLSYLGLQEVSIPFIRTNGAWSMQFEDQQGYTLLALGLLVVTMAIVSALERSRLGASLLSIRQNEWAAEAAGIDAHRTKLQAFAISAAIAAAAGTLYAAVLLVVTPHSVFGLGVTVKALMVTLVGGLATVWGAVIGAAILIPLSHFLLSRYGADFPGIDNVVLGLFLMLVIVIAPDGLYWKARQWFGSRRTGADAARQTATPMPARPIAAPHAPVRSTTPGQELLRTVGLSKSFRGVAAVSGVDFHAGAGEIVGVIGPNGAGKTTLMNLVNGFERPDRGEVWMCGERCTGMAPWQMCRLSLGRTFQVPRVMDRRSVVQNVEIGAFHLVSSLADARALALEALERVGLAAHADGDTSSLSTAGIRKLELARALVGRPRLLLLDEPLAGLSGEDIREFSALVKRLKSEGLGIVIIEHTMSAMVDLVDRFIVLAEGAVIAAGSPAEVTSHPDVIDAYLGKGWVPDAAH